MAKRKSKKKKSTSPNLPESTLKRARRQLDGTLDEDAPPEDDALASDASDADAEADAAHTEVETVAEPAAEAEHPKNEAKAKATAPEVKSTRTTSQRSSRRRERRASTPATRRSSTEGPSSQRKKRDELDNETISHLLANPTKHVSEEQLHEEYGYVLADLRNMGVLAAALMVLLVALAQFL